MDTIFLILQVVCRLMAALALCLAIIAVAGFGILMGYIYRVYSNVKGEIGRESGLERIKIKTKNKQN